MSWTFNERGSAKAIAKVISKGLVFEKAPKTNKPDAVAPEIPELEKQQQQLAFDLISNLIEGVDLPKGQEFNVKAFGHAVVEDDKVVSNTFGVQVTTDLIQ